MHWLGTKMPFSCGAILSCQWPIFVSLLSKHNVLSSMWGAQMSHCDVVCKITTNKNETVPFGVWWHMCAHTDMSQNVNLHCQKLPFGWQQYCVMCHPCQHHWKCVSTNHIQECAPFPFQLNVCGIELFGQILIPVHAIVKAAQENGADGVARDKQACG